MVKLNLEYSIEDKKWLNYILENSLKDRIENLLKCVLKVLKIKNTLEIELSMVFTNDKNIQKINKKFRQKNTPTNVLSFPMYESEFFEIIKKEKYVVLGDIVLSLDTIIKEIEEQNITFDYHLNHLIVHSILHLIGFDHIGEDEADEMEKIEKEVLNLLCMASLP
jgi:probable rRNA maturation factor